MEYRAKAKDFGDFLERTVGRIGYLFATRGELCTQGMIDARLKNPAYSPYHNNIRNHGPQWIGKIVVDCKGYLEMFLNGGDLGKPLTSFKYKDVSTWYVYDLARRSNLPHGPINTLPRDYPYPIAVGYDGHVGYFYRGSVYQAAGHRVGTVKGPLNSTAHNRAWQYWYMIPWLDYENNRKEELPMNCPYKEPTQLFTSGVTFRGEDARWFIWHLLALDYDLVAHSDIAGPNTWKAIHEEQKRAGLTPGDAGPKTREALKKRVQPIIDASTDQDADAGETNAKISALEKEVSELKSKISAAQKALS